MSQYLDPKTDIVFKKIFGEHPALLKSFLNAVLPLPEDGLIESFEYLPSEQVPVIPLFKWTIVDVRCKDIQGRVFIVEMQIQPTQCFMRRVLFNASTAYVRQLEKGEHYKMLKPVYGLALCNYIFDKDTPDCYHHYTMVNVEKPYSTIKDLQLIFIELPKFKPQSFNEKKLQVLWLRFMSELDEKTKTVPTELLEIEEIKQAIELSQESAYSPEELAGYDQYWDIVRIGKGIMGDYYEQGLEKGLEQGQLFEKQRIAKHLVGMGMNEEQIAQIMGL